MGKHVEQGGCAAGGHHWSGRRLRPRPPRAGSAPGRLGASREVSEAGPPSNTGAEPVDGRCTVQNVRRRECSILAVWLTSALLLGRCSEAPSTCTVGNSGGTVHSINRQSWDTSGDPAAAPIDVGWRQMYGRNEGCGPVFLWIIWAVAVEPTYRVYVLDDENHRLVAGPTWWHGLQA